MRILVVDEDHDLVHSLARLLKLKGYLVDEATSGVEAVKLAQEHCPCVVFLEYSVRNLSSGEICRLIQCACPQAMVIITVASESEFQEVRANGLKAFCKPFEMAELFKTVETLDSVHDKVHLSA